MGEAPLEALLRRDRLVTGVALTLLVAVAWAYLLTKGSSMPGMGPMSGMEPMPGMSMSDRAGAVVTASPWSWVEVGALTVMWSLMMVAMMTGSAAPMVLAFAAIHRRRAEQGRPSLPTALFVSGYLGKLCTRSHL
jgi:predicted metal-binding membrane protein